MNRGRNGSSALGRQTLGHPLRQSAAKPVHVLETLGAGHFGCFVRLPALGTVAGKNHRLVFAQTLDAVQCRKIIQGGIEGHIFQTFFDVSGVYCAADALGKNDWGRVEVGAFADYLVVDSPEALTPLYTWGSPPLREMVIGGQSVWRRDG